jgi:hypothetical protein
VNTYNCRQAGADSSHTNNYLFEPSLNKCSFLAIKSGKFEKKKKCLLTYHC